MAKKSQKRLNKINKLIKSRQNKSRRVKNKMMKKVGGAGWYHRISGVSFNRRNNTKELNCEYIAKMKCGKYLADKEIYDKELIENECNDEIKTKNNNCIGQFTYADLNGDGKENTFENTYTELFGHHDD